MPILIDSPSKRKKFRVIFEDGTKIDFGGRGYSDYTMHGDAHRMRAYLRRHGGKMKSSSLRETDSKRIHAMMISVVESERESWGKSGIQTAGFWSRWLLWSMPSISDAISFIETKFDVKIDVKIDAKF